jgi:hypothetical protein
MLVRGQERALNLAQMERPSYNGLRLVRRIPMPTYKLPDSIVNDLQRLQEPVQLCDASGRTLGTFLPAVDPSEYEIIGPDLTKEEIRQILESDKWYSTEEVLRHLESLE